MMIISYCCVVLCCVCVYVLQNYLTFIYLFVFPFFTLSLCKQMFWYCSDCYPKIAIRTIFLTNEYFCFSFFAFLQVQKKTLVITGLAFKINKNQLQNNFLGFRQKHCFPCNKIIIKIHQIVEVMWEQKKSFFCLPSKAKLFAKLFRNRLWKNISRCLRVLAKSRLVRTATHQMQWN